MKFSEIADYLGYTFYYYFCYIKKIDFVFVMENLKYDEIGVNILEEYGGEEISEEDFIDYVDDYFWNKKIENPAECVFDYSSDEIIFEDGSVLDIKKYKEEVS